MVSKTWFQDDNVANPTTTVTAETVYTVMVTLASGCEFRNQVIVRPLVDMGLIALSAWENP